LTWTGSGSEGLPAAYTVKRFRPLARRRFKTCRPPRALMRLKKPWVRARRTLLG